MHPSERRRLVKGLELAIARSVPPVRMDGYWRCWATWLRVARGLGLRGRQTDGLLGVYQSAALAACERRESA